MRKLAWLLPFVAIPLLWSCGKAEREKGDKVLAVVNGATITERMFETEANSLPPYVRPILETPNGKFQFLESLVTRDLLMQEALRRGIDRRDDVRDRMVLARKSIILDALLREISEKAPGLSEESLRKFYEANKDGFHVGERVRASHVLFKERAQAEDVARKANAGVPFEELMKAAAAEGGVTADLGMIERGKFDKAFEDAVFSAASGSTVGPVKTSYGFHAIRVGERKPAGLQPFEEVREQIVSELREQAQREAFDALLSRIRKQASIEFKVEPVPAPPAPGAGAPGDAPRTDAPSPRAVR